MQTRTLSHYNPGPFRCALPARHISGCECIRVLQNGLSPRSKSSTMPVRKLYVSTRLPGRRHALTIHYQKNREAIKGAKLLNTILRALHAALNLLMTKLGARKSTTAMDGPAEKTRVIYVLSAPCVACLQRYAEYSSHQVRYGSISGIPTMEVVDQEGNIILVGYALGSQRSDRLK